jgi:hypothetical protein
MIQINQPRPKGWGMTAECSGQSYRSKLRGIVPALIQIENSVSASRQLSRSSRNLAVRMKAWTPSVCYQGHGYPGTVDVHVERHRGRTAKSLWRWMKRRAAIEPGIGHLKREHRMDRNRLSGTVGDQINAILSTVGMNFHKLLRWAADCLRQIFCWLLSYIKEQRLLWSMLKIEFFRIDLFKPA